MCSIGSPYIVTANTDVVKGIANGTMCHLVDVILRADAIVHVVIIADGSKIHAVYSDDVTCLLFRHRLLEFRATSRFASLPPGYFPVLPATKSIHLRHGIKQTSFSFRINQFSCILANVLTGHKLQGQSQDSIVLARFHLTIFLVHQVGFT